MRKLLKVQGLRFNIILFLGLSLGLSLSPRLRAQTNGPWEEVKLALELGMKDLALKRLKGYHPPNQREKERTWLALGYIYFKEKDYQKARTFLKKIPPSSIYYPAAQVLSWNQEMEIEEVQGVTPLPSPPYRVFQKMLKEDPLTALDYLVLNSPFLLPGEREKGAMTVLDLLFWRGRDDKVLALLQDFPSLAKKEKAIWKGALAHYRRGELKEALALLKDLPPSPKVQYWQARILSLLRKEKEALGKLHQVARGWGFYPFLARVKLGKSMPLYEPCPRATLEGKPLYRDLEEMGLEEVAQKLVMDELWNQEINRDQALNLLTTINPSLALKLGLKGCLLYPHRELVEGFCRIYGVEPSLAYAVMRQESMFDKRAKSRSNALGLMQVLPTTGREISTFTSQGTFIPSMLFVPIFSIKYGLWYLAYLEKRFPTLPLVIAAYNAGPTAVATWYKKWGMASAPEVAEFFPKAETRNYIKRVITYYLLYSSASRP